MEHAAKIGTLCPEQSSSLLEGLLDERQVRQRMLRRLRSGQPPERSDVVALVKWAMHFRTPNEEALNSANMIQRMAAEGRVYEQRLASLGMTDEEYRQETNELLERFGDFVARNDREIRG